MHSKRNKYNAYDLHNIKDEIINTLSKYGDEVVIKGDITPSGDGYIFTDTVAYVDGMPVRLGYTDGKVYYNNLIRDSSIEDQFSYARTMKAIREQRIKWYNASVENVRSVKKDLGFFRFGGGILAFITILSVAQWFVFKNLLVSLLILVAGVALALAYGVMKFRSKGIKGMNLYDALPQEMKDKVEEHRTAHNSDVLDLYTEGQWQKSQFIRHVNNAMELIYKKEGVVRSISLPDPIGYMSRNYVVVTLYRDVKKGIPQRVIMAEDSRAYDSLSERLNEVRGEKDPQDFRKKIFEVKK